MSTFVLFAIVTLWMCNKLGVVSMKRIELRKLRALKRMLEGSMASFFARAFRFKSSVALDESDEQSAGELVDRYVPYAEQAGARFQLLGMERRKADAVDLARRSTCM